MMTILILLTEPVAVVAIILVLLNILARKRLHDTSMRRLLLAITLFYLAVATPIGANFAVGLLENAVAEEQRCKQVDDTSTVVILGGGKSGHPDSADDYSHLHEASMRRIIDGSKLALQSSQALVVVAGGAGADGYVKEGDLLAAMTRQMGVPTERLITDRVSRTTAQTAENLATLAELHDRKNIHLVTTAMHMLRAKATFEKQGFTVCAVPVDRRWVDSAAYELFIPQMTALRKSTEAYHEVLGYLMYWATGKL